MICETQVAQDRAINLPVHHSDAAAETQLGSKIPGLICFWETAPKANGVQGQLLKKGSEWSRRDQNRVRMCVLSALGLLLLLLELLCPCPLSVGQSNGM